jgi:heat-inducible transcriptional repressor
MERIVNMGFDSNLSERETSILRYVVQQFILTANPVGSRFISKHFDLNLSPATIRNVLADLEYLGYIDHPHTSAGRIPTDKGYRFYVDAIEKYDKLPETVEEEINKNLENITNLTDDLLRESSKILGAISKEIAIISLPKISKGVFKKLDLIEISSNRIMVIISLISGLVKTIVLEVDAEISSDKLNLVGQILNERLQGLTIKEIRDTFIDRFRDVSQDKSGLIRIFVNSLDQLFDDFPSKSKIHLAGTPGIFNQPEFSDADSLKSIIEVIENEDIIVHVIQDRENVSDDLVITIGEEHKNEKLHDYSLITTKYNVGDVSGIVGIMGPKRMDYSKLVSMVNYFSKNISTLLEIKK